MASRVRRLPAAWALVLCAAAPPASAEPAEIASLGPHDAAFQWRTDAPRTSVVFIRPFAADAGPASDGGQGEWRTLEDPAPAGRDHFVEVDDLLPGTSYEYRLGDGGPSGTLATPLPPPGEVRAVLYVLADIHLCVGDCPDGVRRLSAARDAYAAAWQDIRRRSATLPAELPRAAVILGDLSQQPSPATWTEVSKPDHGDVPLCVLPGNHDGWDADWAARLAALEERLASPACRYDGDHGVLDLGPWRVLLLASIVPGENEGRLGDTRRAWLDTTLAEAPDRPTLLATHHPYAAHPAAAALGREARFTFLQDGTELESLLARHPQVAAVLSGHVHVNWTGARGAVAQLLFSALAQYPMGYHSLTLYDGGLVRRYHPLPAMAAEAAASARKVRAWGESTGIPFAGGVTALVYGSTADRNTVLVTAAPPDPGSEPAAPDAVQAADVGAAVPEGGAADRDAASVPGPAPAAPTRGSSGCRCAAGGMARPGGAWSLVALAAWFAVHGAVRRRREPRPPRRRNR
jgi:Icc protein